MHRLRSSLPIAVAAAVAATTGSLAACGKPLDGGQSSTDYYREMVDGSSFIGAVRVRAATDGDRTTLTFADVDKAWVDPRPNGKGPGNPPMLASATCTLTASRDNKKMATVTPGQSCSHEGRTVTVTRGSVWVADGAINIDLAGTVDGKDYMFTYPMSINGNPLPLTKD